MAPALCWLTRSHVWMLSHRWRLQVAMLNQPVTTDLLLSLMRIWSSSKPTSKFAIELRVNALCQAFEKDLLLYALKHYEISATALRALICYRHPPTSCHLECFA